MTSKIKAYPSTKLLKREFNVSELLTNIRSVGPVVWSWGMCEMSNMNNKGLVFKVNGHHHKGWVLITLDWSDTFEVHLINSDGSIKKTFDMVYIDSLIDTIDTAVEKIADYQY
jgi:hypothetical protein